MKLGNVGVIVAARTLSSRLPGKALLPLQGVPMIAFLLRRLSQLSGATVIVATTTLPSDDRLAEVVKTENVPVYRGADADVVARYVGAAKQFGFETVARVTGDCPFVDADLVNWCVAQAKSFERFDLASTKGRFPVGLDVEIYPADVMARLHEEGHLSSADREHLTLCFYESSDQFVVRQIDPRPEWQNGKMRFTVDTPDDYQAALALASKFSSPRFAVADLLARAA